MPINESQGDPAEDGDLSDDTFAPAAPTLTARIGRRTLDDEVVELDVAYADVNGKAIYQGDIVIGASAHVAERERKRKSSFYGLIIATAGEKWPHGRVPYLVDAASRNVVEKAATHFAAHTSVRLVPKTDADLDYVRVITGESNDSMVGRQGGEQTINLTARCSMGTAVHEFCHALGLWHEQCRPDRDQYITVVEDNVLAGCMPQFAIQATDAARVGAYDYRSIMHYGPTAFSDPEGSVTIKTRNGESIGQRAGLSPGDIASLRKLYP